MALFASILLRGPEEALVSYNWSSRFHCLMGSEERGAQEANSLDRRYSDTTPREFRGWSRHAVISVALRKVYSILPEDRSSDLMQRLMQDFRRMEG